MRAAARAARCCSIPGRQPRCRWAIQLTHPTRLDFHLDNVVINTTASTSPTAQAFAAYRTQEMDLESLYLLGNANQTGMTLDGTGNYTGGTFFDNQIQRVSNCRQCESATRSANPADDRLAERQHVCAVAHRLPDERRKSDSGDLWDQSAAGRRKHLYRRRRRGMLDSTAPGRRMHRTTRSLVCATRTRPTRWWRTRAVRTTTGSRAARCLPAS